MNHLVIMAGGVGSRFWPMSTPDKPKQFLDILGVGRTLLQLTVDRFQEICPPENIWIVTAKRYKDLVKEQLPGIEDSHILLEPCLRNTAPCIAYVAWKIKKKYPHANLVVSPSDHIVTDLEEFERVVRKGLRFTEKEDRILTLGMYPSWPETGYGYIKMSAESGKDDGGILKVEAFKEKPDKPTAENYLADGHYTWNAGLFLWNTDTLEKAFRLYQPGIAALFDELEGYFYTEEEQDVLDRRFPECEKISIDYAIMEKAENIYVLPASFGWSDLGTWGSLYELSAKDEQKNAVVAGTVKLIECRNCIVHVSGGQEMVLQGLEDCIVAERNGKLLVCKKSEEQRIKEFSEGLSL